MCIIEAFRSSFNLRLKVKPREIKRKSQETKYEDSREGYIDSNYNVGD